MSVITNINGIPLFATTRQALIWAQQNGLVGYHRHRYKGQIGYMGGYNHSEATGSSMNTVAPQPLVPQPPVQQVQQVQPPPPPIPPQQTPQPPPSPQPPQQTPQPPPSTSTGGGSGSSGGGGGGY